MSYSLIIICQTLVAGTMCLFQINDTWEQNGIVPVVWVSRTVNGTSTVVFTWNDTLSLGCKITTTHRSFKIPAVLDTLFIHERVNPEQMDRKAFILSYKQGWYRFEPVTPDTEDRNTITLETRWTIPVGSKAVAGLCMAILNGEPLYWGGDSNKKLVLVISKYWGKGRIHRFRVRFIDTPVPSPELRAKIVTYMNKWATSANVHFWGAVPGQSERVSDTGRGRHTERCQTPGAGATQSGVRHRARTYPNVDQTFICPPAFFSLKVLDTLQRIG